MDEHEFEKSVRKNMDTCGSPHDYVSGVFFCSELPFCRRKSVLYRHLGVKPKMNGPMFAGTAMHRLIPELLKDYPSDIKNYEVECSHIVGENIRIVGHADVVVDDRIIEFKFTDSRSLADGMAPYYAVQANCYAIMLKRERYTVVMVSRETLDIKCLTIDVDKEAFDNACSEALLRQSALDNGELPDGPMYGFECRGCTFDMICKKIPVVKK